MKSVYPIKKNVAVRGREECELLPSLLLLVCVTRSTRYSISPRQTEITVIEKQAEISSQHDETCMLIEAGKWELL